jgi:hypothetical protein
MGDQPVARPLPAHRTTQTQNKRTNIHALSGIRNHDPSVRTAEDGSCLRPRGNCDRLTSFHVAEIYGAGSAQLILWSRNFLETPETLQST